MTTVMILAGESSGELYGALLTEALRRRRPDLHIIGIGGSRMREAGVELISQISDAFGLFEAVSSLRKIKTALLSARRALKKYRPEVLIPIDYPDFNLKVAAMARPLGAKILYYVSPQVWAWRRGRVKRIARLVDKMAVILPFEEEIYRHAGLDCEFVGHPVLEEIESLLGHSRSRQPSERETEHSEGLSALITNGAVKSTIKDALGLDVKKPLLSILPGSRPAELSRHFPLIVEMVRQLRSNREISSVSEYQICVPLAPNTREEDYDMYVEELRREDVAIRKGESVRALAASDIAVVASGTATLQAALLEVPMVVIYKLSPLTYQLGKRIVNVKYISLVNLLSGKEVVKELLQKKANPGEIVRELEKIVSNACYRDDMIAELRRIKSPFSGKRPSERVAEIVLEMAGEKQ